jgi:methylated-DNA-[protein]-cysteine S-methyltransferase
LPQLSMHTSIGDLSIAEDAGAIVSLDWGWGSEQTVSELLARAREQLYAYLDGGLTRFDLPLRPVGTSYRRRIWSALLDIPYGSTCSYADIARRTGGSPRSVGQANGANPIPIIIPCHRVLASNGIGGYSGGQGLATKRALLALEARATPLFTSAAA